MLRMLWLRLASRVAAVLSAEWLGEGAPVELESSYAVALLSQSEWRPQARSRMASGRPAPLVNGVPKSRIGPMHSCLLSKVRTLHIIYALDSPVWLDNLLS